MIDKSILGKTASWLEPNQYGGAPRAIVGPIIAASDDNPAGIPVITVAERGDGEVHHVALDGATIVNINSSPPS